MSELKYSTKTKTLTDKKADNTSSKSKVNYFDANLYKASKKYSKTENKAEQGKDKIDTRNENKTDTHVDNNFKLDIDALKKSVSSYHATIIKKHSTKSGISRRFKLMATTYATVTSLILIMGVYNIFAINSISSDINSISGNISTHQTFIDQISIERIIKDIGNISEEEPIVDVASSIGFSQSSNSNTVDGNDVETPYSYSSPDNWFDKILNRINSFFN